MSTDIAAAARRAMRIAQREGLRVVSVKAAIGAAGNQKEEDTMRTYTIAMHDAMIIATEPDGVDIVQAVVKEAERAGIEIDLDDIEVIEGVTLVDAEEEGDEVVFRVGPHTGYLVDEAGRRYNLAVIRRA